MVPEIFRYYKKRAVVKYLKKFQNSLNHNVLASLHETLLVKQGRRYNFEHYPSEFLAINETEKTLQVLAPFCQHLTIPLRKFAKADYIIPLITFYCHQIQCLRIIGTSYRGRMEGFPTDLRYLQLEIGFLTDDDLQSYLFISQHTLRELDIRKSFVFKGYPLDMAWFPKITAITLESCNQLDKGSVYSFLFKNPQLKKIFLVGCQPICSAVIFVICTSIPLVEHLFIDYYDDRTSKRPLNVLKNAKSIRISRNGNFREYEYEK